MEHSFGSLRQQSLSHPHTQILNISPILKRNFNKVNWPRFYDLTADTHSLPITEPLDQDTTSFTEFIIQAAEISILKTKSNSNSCSVYWRASEVKTTLHAHNKAIHFARTAKARSLDGFVKKQTWNSFITKIDRCFLLQHVEEYQRANKCQM